MNGSLSRRISKNGLLSIFRYTWHALAIFLVILAIVFTFFRALTPWVKQYRSEIQQQLALRLGQIVEIQDISTSWYWFTPVLNLNHVVIGDGHKQILHFNQVMIGINLFSSLFHRHIQPGLLYVDNVHLTLLQEQDGWRIAGLSSSSEASPNRLSSTRIKPIIGLLLDQDKVIIKHLSANLRLVDGTAINLNEVSFKLDHHADIYQLHSKATIGGNPSTQMSLMANMTVDGQHSDLLSGRAFLSLSSIDLTLAKKLFRQPHLPMQQGFGRVEAWFNFVHGRLDLVQAEVKLKDLELQAPNRAKPHNISNAVVNIAWKNLSHGWRLSADHCKVTFDGVTWPENAFQLEYQRQTDEYTAYVSTVPLNLLIQADLPWPELVKPILALQPTGELHDTKITWHQTQISDFLTQFHQLSWEANDTIPGLSGVTGVIDWQPTEGRLELVGERSKITLKKPLAPIMVDSMNAILDWKYLSQGWRISLDQLVINHPNLLLSAEGVIDDPFGSAANLRLQMDFSAKEGQMWLPYIPSKGLKPKLDAWLKQDIPRIAHASGRLRIVGPLAEFPFDNQNGEFTIQSHVNGVDLLIDKHWPINADLDADIRVSGRQLVADVHQAYLNDVLVKQVSIIVPNIGLGKEVFLLHGKVDAPGEKIKAYIFSSPLRTRFARWKSLSVSDVLGLDLNLEAPLYPESNHIYAKGSLEFEQNSVLVDLGENPAKFEGVKGRLDFNEYGLTSGGLDGALNNYPFTIRVQPLLGPQSGTELRVDGEVDVAYLQSLFHLPIFSVMQGQFIVNGLWTVYPDSPESDKLFLNSSLTGLAVHLPPPFGKTSAAIAPVEVKINFAPKNQINFDLKYAQNLSGIFTTQKNPLNHWETTGDLNFGKDSMPAPGHSGLRISGTLPEFNVDAWRTVWNKWPKDTTTPSLLSNLKEVNLKIDHFNLPTIHYTAVNLRAHPLSPHEWSLHWDQKDMRGEFRYNWQKNSLFAHLARLNLAAFQSSSAAASQKWKPNLQDIPNLDVTIDTVTYLGIAMGKLSFNSSTLPEKWILNTGKLETPEYALNFKGNWIEHNQTTVSNFDAELTLSRLVTALNRWHVTPVVDAHYGSLKFSGHWPSAFYDSSIRQLHGNLSILLTDGNISHLDQDTEKKIGLGKLLSILSLQTIPRRLKLDFSDLAQKGFTFDLFKGTFQIHSGIMHTNDSYINGPVAYGRMSGDLDLVNHLYDLDLRIFPYITASLPVVASIVGSPVAGVAVWAVSSLASKGMQKISGYSYKISGPWLSPVVQQVSIHKSKLTN